MRILFLPSPVTHNFCYGIPEVIIYAVNSVQILQQILHFSRLLGYYPTMVGVWLICVFPMSKKSSCHILFHCCLLNEQYINENFKKKESLDPGFLLLKNR